MELYPSSARYESNKAIMKLLADGFVLKREDRSKKDLFVQLIDFSALARPKSHPVQDILSMAAQPEETYRAEDPNIYKIVN